MTKNEETKALLERLREGDLPAHVALIMDGNGRWAESRRLPRWEGHRAGMAAVREAVEGAIEARLGHLTLFAFSNENWDRPRPEIDALMGLLVEYVEGECEELVETGVRVGVFGDRSRLSEAAVRAIEELERATRNGEALWLHLAISYGSRAEITEASRSLARSCLEGRLRPEEITESRFAEELLTREWPDPDLLIRTSGELRLSNFLLWQVAYAELYVTPVLWPDFGRRDLFEALLEYQRRERRFGRVEV